MERLYSDDYNKIYLAILKQIPFSECGYEGAEAQSVYGDILKELEEAPVGIMPMLVNEWGGDEYDGFISCMESNRKSEDNESKGNYALILSGSSIFGIIRDKKIWEKSYSFLNAKSMQGKLKCFIWWCNACKISPLVLGGDPCNHVIKISIPNVLKLIDGFGVQWEWKDPQSEWAIGTANESFRDLVARKSRPNWVIEISKP